ncbi:Hsp20/alpha crystallin family protein [Cohnella candidum]|uniref:Hsp20/alpha crystallin family protein n=1 Tax=Cohnella candidum TaxID=2674991 RepID=A0A3G3JYD4_9BACL|nr:Hsp20/alpha crystallin family protein [Cohnella candidum]AYQ72867.1 hypothetical protein EAV92_10015 [Cohnella candidum]
MNRPRNQGMDWTEFQKSLFKKLPFMDEIPNAKGIEDFVKKAIDSFMPKALPIREGLKKVLPGPLDCEVFETHRSVFVRCKLPRGVSRRDVRFHANRRKLKIGLGERSEEIRLPSDVQPSRASASVRDGIVEIRLPKSGGAEPFREIFVRDGGK